MTASERAGVTRAVGRQSLASLMRSRAHQQQSCPKELLGEKQSREGTASGSCAEGQRSVECLSGHEDDLLNVQSWAQARKYSLLARSLKLLQGSCVGTECAA